jgi:ankyrin repeat protein
LVDCGAAFKVWPKGCIPPLVGASEGSEPEHTAIAAWLLGLGAPVDGETATGRTALMRASTSNNPELVELLLSRGADVNHHSKEGLTPLLCCVANAKWLRSRDATEKALRIAKALAVAGADLGIRCEPQSGIPVGGTALEIAETAEDPTMANYLRGVTSAALPRRAS